MGSQDVALERLAELANVAIAYEDALGAEQRAAPNALRAVLAALGLDATDEAAAERSAHALVGRSWKRVLEPVYVVAAESEISVAVTRPVERDAAELAWDVVAEDGGLARGRVRFATLAPLASASIDGVRYERRALPLPAVAPGYYRLRVDDGVSSSEATIVRTPARCWLPDAVADRGVWGLAVQLYALRSARNWGIGDFTDLATLCAQVAALGGSVVGLNPLHAVRTGRGTPSPYSPSTRLFSSWLYLDIEAMPGFDASDVDRTVLAAVRASVDVDYVTVAALKSGCARRAFERFRSGGGSRAFDAFVEAGGDTLWRAATFEALAADAERRGESADWATWPEPFRDADSAEVAAFARDRATDVAFFAYLQWQIDIQLAACVRAGPLAVGLYRDLAVGADVAGSEVWSFANTMTRDATVGAPPDILNVRGQNWSVAPFDPLRLREAAYAPFVALLRANMRHAGALRIDHVMALARLYWIPSGSEPTLGAFVGFDLGELLGIVALESVRNRCMVIGEDLGTVPKGFRETLADRGVLSYRLLQFEVDDDGFTSPEEYPRLALVSTGTHDLPPMAAYWTGSDLDVRAGLGFYADDAEREARERAERDKRRQQLLAAIDREFGTDPFRADRFLAAIGDGSDRETLAELALFANRFLARTPTTLLMVQLEDMLGEVDQINVPTTIDEHPNWRRRASLSLERFQVDARFTALANALRHESRARERIASPNPE